MNDKHIASLDGLRGIAILLVILYHYFPHRGTGYLGYFFSASWIGVDLFFVLSGFLITGILFDTRGIKGFFRKFFARRALRLFPAYFLFVCMTLLIARGFGSHPRGETIAYLFYASNIVRFFDPGFMSIGPVDTGHLWSLALEEQFYLIWPWIVAWLADRRRILRVCVAGSIAALILRLVLAKTSIPALALYLELPTRADALLMGGALAMLWRDPQLKSRIRPKYVRLVGLLAVVGFLAISYRVHSFYFGLLPIKSWGFSLVAIACAALLFLSITQGTWTQRICSLSFFRFFGRYSYGIYLIHYAPHAFIRTRILPALAARTSIAWLSELIVALVVLILSTLLAVLSYHAVEKPFLKLKKLFEYTFPPRHEQ